MICRRNSFNEDLLILESLTGTPTTNTTSTLFRKKRFEINFFVRQNVSKFAIFIEKENPRSFFHLEHF